VPLPGQNFYVFYSRGYLAGGANSSSTDHPTFSPEGVNDWELGWKGRLLDGHMVTQVGTYYEKFQGMQYPLEDLEAADDTTIGSYTANLATATIYGLEVSEQSRFGGLGVNLGFNYNHSAIGPTTTLPAYALPVGWGSPTAIPQCLAGHTYATTPGCFNYTPYLATLTGEANPLAPSFTGNLSVDYLFHVGVGTLDPRVTFSYVGKQYASLFQIPYNEMDARHLYNASVDWVVNQWDLQLWGTNLTNLTYIIAGGNPAYYGAPRQVGFQGTYTF
jgi:iron complex outermembrane receptor protein